MASELWLAVGDFVVIPLIVDEEWLDLLVELKRKVRSAIEVKLTEEQEI